MDMLKEAGWPIWIVLVLGSFSVVQAVRHRVGSAGGREVVGAVAAALLAGVWATAGAAQLAFGTLQQLPDPAQQHWLAFVGLKEALYNLDLACACGVLSALVATVGRRRTAVASAV